MVFSRTRIVAFFILTLVLGFGLWCLYGFLSVRGIESPAYTVTASHETYEVRDYAPMIIATTTVDGTLSDATVIGFKRIAAYIFGGNALHQSIAMTTPVTTEQAKETGDGTTTSYGISFILPSSSSMDNLPLPNDAKVRVESVPAQTIAVSSFYGYADEATVTEKMQLLKEAVEKDGYTVSGELTLAQYNPPFTPWFMRRNEVWAEVLMVR